MTFTFPSTSFIVFTTSKYRGSPAEPGSLVRSSTAIFFTDFGSAFKKYLALNGRYR